MQVISVLAGSGSVYIGITREGYLPLQDFGYCLLRILVWLDIVKKLPYRLYLVNVMIPTMT
jgi:hypothetical protein